MVGLETEEELGIPLPFKRCSVCCNKPRSPAVRTNPAGAEGAVGVTDRRAVAPTGSAITSPLRAKPLPREPINAGLATSGATGDPTCTACVASMACTA